MSAPALATARLRLRALESCDRALFHELYGDAETMRHIGRPASRAENAASFRATLQALHQPRRPQFLAVVRKRDGAAIGICSIRRISTRERSAEIGIMLVRKARGYGYALEARRAFIDAVFRALPIDTIWVQNHKSNVDVARLNAKLGFSESVDWRPRGVKRGWCVRVLQRSTWHAQSNQRADHITRVRDQLPIGIVWGQYQQANTAVVLVKGALGYAVAEGGRTRGAERWSVSRKSSDQRGEYCMSNIIGFLESAGRNAAMRYATREQLLHMMEREEIATERSVLDSLLGVRDTMYCGQAKITPPKMKKPAKKTPAKKAPAKKPAKKAPSKKK